MPVIERTRKVAQGGKGEFKTGENRPGSSSTTRGGENMPGEE